MLHLDQQVKPLLKWLQGMTKAPANRINLLTRVDLVDATLQACQDFPKVPFLFPTSAWHLQSARASKMHLEQQVQLFPKWLWGRTKAPANSINELTRVDLADTPLMAGQDLLKSPFLFPTSA